ncbi:MAG: class I SAM-dependent methyltransferase [Candidatus Diapherotrites archaeon]
MTERLIVNMFNIKNKKLLEIGCGAGRFTRVLGEKNKVFPTDVKKYELNDFVQASAFNLPFKEKSFDAVFVAFVLHHLKDINKVLKEIKRVLKPKGTYYGIEPNGVMFYLYAFILKISGGSLNKDEKAIYSSQIKKIFSENEFFVDIDYVVPSMPKIKNKFFSTSMIIKAKRK